MLGVGLLYQFALVSLILGIYAVVRYAFPDSLPGRVSAALVG
jgi:hypothetical protein